MSSQGSALIAVDTGGTFTDVVCLHDGVLHNVKVASTPANPASAVIAGIQAALDQVGSGDLRYALVHGSTVATNALLERKGATVVLITNRGFEDVLEIGRQTRPQLYALSGHRKPPLVPVERRLGVAGRLGPRGEVIEPIEPDDVARTCEQVRALGAESVAVCLLHSYANPDAELAIGEALRTLGVPVSLSHAVLAEYREFERGSTTVVNAYVAPLMAHYLGHLEHHLQASSIRIMGSSGGAIAVTAARRQPVHTVLSGPAGGVAGAMEVARQAGFDRIVTFDMGGTSTDVSICPGHMLHTREFSIDGVPIAIPVIDIHTVGAGGGSIAWLDAGGALRVGPRSAGALPGPICYGRGGQEVTVTDAQVWLNRLPADAFLGGQQTLDRAAIEGPLTALARQLGRTPEAAAEGVIEVVNTSMEGALRVITVERGHDPVDFTLVAFGGAAGLHAVELAVRLSIPRILLPRDPGLLSAYGMLVSPVRKDAARTVLIRADSADAELLGTAFEELEAAVREDLRRDGVAPADVELSRAIDARYRGQSFELRVTAHDWVNAFHRAHQHRYGYAQPNAVVEAVTLRVVGVAVAPDVPSPSVAAARRAPRPDRTLDVGWNGRTLRAQQYDRDRLRAGQHIGGPAVLVEYSSTGWVPPGWVAQVQRSGHLVFERTDATQGKRKRSTGTNEREEAR